MKRLSAERLIISVVLTALICVSLVPSYVIEASARRADTLIVAGDGIGAGRGLDDRAGKAFGALLASSIGATGGKYINIADDSADSQALLDKLFLYENDISNSDIMVVSVGADDIMPYFTSAIEAVVSSRVSYSELLQKAAEPGFADKFIEATDSAGILGATARYAVNLGKIISEIKRYNPDINIVLLGIYNPLDGIEAFDGINPTIDTNIAMLNEKMNLVASDYDCRVIDLSSAFKGESGSLTNITSLDASPNTEGHRVIAQLLIDYAAELPDLPEPTSESDASDTSSDNVSVTSDTAPAASDTDDLGVIISEEPSRAALYIVIAGGVCIVGILTVLLAVRLNARGKNDK